MSVYHQPMVSPQDTYSSVYSHAGRNWEPYRTSMGNNPTSFPYAGEGQVMDAVPGVSLAEARQLYRQAYQVPVRRDMMSSLELGHAAAYSAYHSTRNRSLQGDIDMERENLIGLAIAEASRLSHQLGRGADANALSAASEAAARTACRIFTQTRGAFGNEPISHSSYTADPYTDFPESGDFEMTQQSPPRTFRGRSVSRPIFSDTAAVISEMGPGQNAHRIPLNDTYSDAPFPGSRYPPTPHPSNTRYYSTPQTLQPYSSASYTNPGTMATAFPTTPSNAVQPQAYQMPSYNQIGTRHRSASFSAPGQAYMAPPVQASYTNTPYGYPATQPAPTIIIEKPKKHRHRHRHHHRHHSRG